MVDIDLVGFTELAYRLNTEFQKKFSEIVAIDVRSRGDLGILKVEN